MRSVITGNISQILGLITFEKEISKKGFPSPSPATRIGGAMIRSFTDIVTIQTKLFGKLFVMLLRGLNCSGPDNWTLLWSQAPRLGMRRLR